MKKYFIYALITSLVIAGLLGIAVLLSGTFDELQIRILFTTLALTVYSIIGLCCNSIVGGKHSVFGKFGLGMSFIGLSYAVATTWATPEPGEFIQLRVSLLVVSICFAHCSLMLSVNNYNSTISAVRGVSISASILATLIALGILSSFDASAGTFKLLGVASIVGVIATIVAPILAFTATKSNHTDRSH